MSTMTPEDLYESTSSHAQLPLSSEESHSAAPPVSMGHECTIRGDGDFQTPLQDGPNNFVWYVVPRWLCKFNKASTAL